MRSGQAQAESSELLSITTVFRKFPMTERASGIDFDPARLRFSVSRGRRAPLVVTCRKANAAWKIRACPLQDAAAKVQRAIGHLARVLNR
jgi:hypothetical protein